MQSKVFNTDSLWGRTPKRSILEMEAELHADVLERQTKINTIQLINDAHKNQLSGINYIKKEKVYDMIATAELYREDLGFDVLAKTGKVDRTISPGILHETTFLEVDIYEDFIDTLTQTYQLNAENIFVELDNILDQIIYLADLDNVFKYLYSPDNIDTQSLLSRFDTHFMKKEMQECQTLFGIALFYKLMRQLAVIHYMVHQQLITNEQATETELYVTKLLNRYKDDFTYNLRNVRNLSNSFKTFRLPTIDGNVDFHETFGEATITDFLKGKSDRNTPGYTKKLNESIKKMRPVLMKAIQSN